MINKLQSIQICACVFLNQVHTGRRPSRPWFLKMVSTYVDIHMYVCPPPRLLITSGEILTPYDWLNKGYSLYMPTVVIIGDGRGLRIEACHRNQPNKSKLLLYKLLFSLNIPFKQLYTSNKM